MESGQTVSTPLPHHLLYVPDGALLEYNVEHLLLGFSSLQRDPRLFCNKPKKNVFLAVKQWVK